MKEQAFFSFRQWPRDFAARVAQAPREFIQAHRRADRQIETLREAFHGQLDREVGELVPCSCDAPTVPGVVLDPFMGAGTVGLVAEQLSRDWIGIEINAEYRALAMKRVEAAR